jgi:hypothetical protein
MSERLEEGSSQIRILLAEVNEVEIHRLMEIFADVLVERGYARDDEVRAALIAEPWEWPEDPDAFIEQVDTEAAVIVIPSEGESDPEAGV